MLIHIRAVLRLIHFSFLIFLYLSNGALIYFIEKDLLLRRKKLVQNCQHYAQLILKAFRVDIICSQNIADDENSLLVGNHLGFIDIVCLQALQGSVFITSLEMKNTPVLGLITDLGGSAYVDRRNRMNIQEELKDITDVLIQGFRVVLYAESVASNGEQVLPFKKTLMMAAGFAQRPIRPFVFNFRKVNGGPVLYSQRDSLCWYGSQSFVPAIWRSMHLDSVVCEIEFLPLIHPTHDSDRHVLAKQLHDAISAKYVPFRPGMNQSKQSS